MAATKLIQVTNISPAISEEQMLTLFGFVGKIEAMCMYPSPQDLEAAPNIPKICYIKFFDATCVGVSQYLTNTVFNDRALVVTPVEDGLIPDEEKAKEMAAKVGLPPAVHKPPDKPKSEIVNLLEGTPPNQVIVSHDPRLEELGLPKYPPLPASYEGHVIEEIRRTVLIIDINTDVTSEELIQCFEKAGDVKYMKFCSRSDNIRYALIEFVEQSHIIQALKMNGLKFKGNVMKVYHSTQAITKPETKSNEVAQREVVEALTRVKEAESLILAAIDPFLSLSKSKKGRSRSKSPRRSRIRRSRSRSRRRSRSRSPHRRRTSPRIRRSRSRSHHRKLRSKSPRRHRKSRSKSPRTQRKSRSKSPRTQRKSRSKSPRTQRKSRSKSPRTQRKSRSKSPRTQRKSRSKSPRTQRKSRSKSPRTQRKSRSKSPRTQRKSRSKSSSRTQRRSRSKTPPGTQPTGRSKSLTRTERGSRSRSPRARRKSRSKSPRTRRKIESKSPGQSKKKSRSKSPSRSKRRSRSKSPPKTKRRSRSPHLRSRSRSPRSKYRPCSSVSRDKPKNAEKSPAKRNSSENVRANRGKERGRDRDRKDLKRDKKSVDSRSRRSDKKSKQRDSRNKKNEKENGIDSSQIKKALKDLSHPDKSLVKGNCTLDTGGNEIRFENDFDSKVTGSFNQADNYDKGKGSLEVIDSFGVCSSEDNISVLNNDAKSEELDCVEDGHVFHTSVQCDSLPVDTGPKEIVKSSYNEISSIVEDLERSKSGSNSPSGFATSHCLSITSG